MSSPVTGVGFLTVIDIVQDVSYVLIEPVVNQTLPVALTVGSQSVPIYDPSIYPGCELVVGAGTANVEVVTVTATSPTNFTAAFVNAHAAGESIKGATFPVRWPTDQFFTPSEMLGYLSTAMNDFLVSCPLAVAVSTAVSVKPSQQNATLPADCMQPERIAANGYPLRESSQTNLEMNDYRWREQSATQPYVYFRDVGLGQVGIWPRANNTVPLEVVYLQRSPDALGWADGFIIPDPYMPIVKARVLEYCFSKDGEQRNPGLAKYWNGRFLMGCKIAMMFLDVIEAGESSMMT